MGERANIAIIDRYGVPSKAHRIYLYTHWDGPKHALHLQNALKRRLRWDDSAYLTRIIFDSMKGDDVTGETGYGISTRLCDNNYPILVVDCDDRRVVVERENGEPLGGWSFEQFITLADPVSAMMELER